MDNVTHSLIGLVEGQVATRLLARRDSRRAAALRPTLWLVGALANNLPDIDSFTLAWLTPGRIGRMLHHRGYTHTLGGLPFEAALLLAAVFLFARRAKKKGSYSPREWRYVGALTVLGLLSHLAADSLNSYGVHALWPFDRRWTYGDTLFIVEPSLWVLLAPALFFEATSRAGRVVLAGTFAAAVGLCFFTGYVPWQLTLLLTGLGAWMWGFCFKLRPNARLTVAVAAALAVIATFGAAGRVARAEIRARVAEDFPTTRLLDVVLSPMPANPLCWTAITIETDRGWYFARHGIYALAPRLLGAAECPELFGVSPNSPDLKTSSPSLVPVPGRSRPSLLWDVQFQGKLQELRSLSDRDCSANALLRFLRAPIWAVTPDDDFVLADMRFRGLRSRDMGLDHRPVGGTVECPPRIPDWGYPRADLLTEAKAGGIKPRPFSQLPSVLPAVSR